MKHKVNWYDEGLEGNNNGYIYGIEWYDENGNFTEIQWFTTEGERDNIFLEDD
tara:strand:+ start:300 stop:458 length:159 start_codon:yes stop_codon:yes gene_type:complete